MSTKRAGRLGRVFGGKPFVSVFFGVCLLVAAVAIAFIFESVLIALFTGAAAGYLAMRIGGRSQGQWLEEVESALEKVGAGDFCTQLPLDKRLPESLVTSFNAMADAMSTRCSHMSSRSMEGTGLARGERRTEKNDRPQK